MLVVDDLDMLAHVLFGAVTAGVLGMGRAAEPTVERQRFRTVMLAVMAGLVRPDVVRSRPGSPEFIETSQVRIFLGNR